MKLRIGIIFGGSSREREISFAGGRTVYDNLDKNLFEPVPVFVDSFGNFILLNWEYIYKGSIRDFFPPFEMLPESPNGFQVYAESLGDLSKAEQQKLINKVGTKIDAASLREVMDVAFLCLHGSDGEDGRIQGLLEYYRIPYSGSGILPSAFGMNKSVQKKWMQQAGFNVPAYLSISRSDWLKDREKVLEEISCSPLFAREPAAQMREAGGEARAVIKPACQGSSIGVSVVAGQNEKDISAATDKSFFITRIEKTEWQKMTHEEKISCIRSLSDIREGLGMPVKIEEKIIRHPEELFSIIINLFADGEKCITLEAADGDSEVLIEEFLDGKEFSCIVIEDENGNPVALPPTEIRKGKEVFDYRSKYLPGLSSKITPIRLPDEQIEKICTECERLFTHFRFNVYARIDGFITNDNKIYLNDPNTTSGMLPSSFFFHQAAEIGLNPSQFLTFIIRTSLAARISDFKNVASLPFLLQDIDHAISSSRSRESEKKTIAVILGGYSTERHISVESGRNIFEKLSSSEKYKPIPVFLTGTEKEHSLWRIPVNILLKDNADDISEKISHFSRHHAIDKIISRCSFITSHYGSPENLAAPQLLTYEDLAAMCDGVFIALHGRPGEDGEVQKNLERVSLPYNGSGPKTSDVTIDKFRTNEIIMNHHLQAPSHLLVHKQDWENNANAGITQITSHFKFPFIAKPVDDGCSSAVKVIRNKKELEAFAASIFRNENDLHPAAASVLKLKPKEEFPRKKSFLIEELVSADGAARFLEITGGMLTHFNEQGEIEYEIFDPSETLSGGDVLSLEEKFLAGEGQNITPARFSMRKEENLIILDIVKKELEKAARLLHIEGYARIDAFVRIYPNHKVEVVFIEVNSLPGMTPATCIFHQAALSNYKPYQFIDKILEFGFRRRERKAERADA